MDLVCLGWMVFTEPGSERLVIAEAQKGEARLGKKQTVCIRWIANYHRLFAKTTEVTEGK